MKFCSGNAIHFTENIWDILYKEGHTFFSVFDCYWNLNILVGGGGIYCVTTGPLTHVSAH
jgi:hypothetical protein